MKKIKIASKVAALAVLACLIVFAAYNAILFVLCGFKEHNALFWVSYAFMMVSFASLFVCGALLRGRLVQPKDWLLGFPVLKHCAIYLLIELVASVIFMALEGTECPWGIAFAVQMVLFVIHLVFIISCFMARTVIEGIEDKVEQKTSCIKLLQVDIEMIAARAKDAEVKAAYTKLAEQVRYSDPMSAEVLADIEQRISKTVEEARELTEKSELLSRCDDIAMLVLERNKKCKVLK